MQMKKVTMAIPSYWGRPRDQGWREGDLVFDHPTPLDEEGTLRRALEKWGYIERPKSPWLRVAPKFQPKPFVIHEEGKPR